MHRLLGVFAAPLFVTGFVAGLFVTAPTMAAPVLPEGTSITGDPTSLLGYDVGLNDYVAGGLSAVNDQNIEFLTDDFALAIDFQSDGLLRLFDNLGTGDDLFNYTFQFSFTGLGGSLAGIHLLDVSALTGGNLLFSVIDNNTFQLALDDVKFAPGFSHADLALAVDEPSMLALFALGIVIVGIARRRSHFVRSAKVTPFIRIADIKP
jgi:hypothetical protein